MSANRNAPLIECTFKGGDSSLWNVVHFIGFFRKRINCPMRVLPFDKTVSANRNAPDALSKVRTPHCGMSLVSLEKDELTNESASFLQTLCVKAV